MKLIERFENLTAGFPTKSKKKLEKVAAYSLKIRPSISVPPIPPSTLWLSVCDGPDGHLVFPPWHLWTQRVAEMWPAEVSEGQKEARVVSPLPPWGQILTACLSPRRRAFTPNTTSFDDWVEQPIRSSLVNWRGRVWCERTQRLSFWNSTKILLFTLRLFRRPAGKRHGVRLSHSPVQRADGGSRPSGRRHRQQVTSAKTETTYSRSERKSLSPLQQETNNTNIQKLSFRDFNPINAVKKNLSRCRISRWDEWMKVSLRLNRLDERMNAVNLMRNETRRFTGKIKQPLALAFSITVLCSA